MFDNLNKYKNEGHFFLKPSDNIDKVCNAPSDKAGVYIIYALVKGKVEMVYIGRSGKVKDDGTIFIRAGGIKERLVNGKRDGKLTVKFWQREMVKRGIVALDIYWYVTHNETYIDCPKTLKAVLLEKYADLYGQLPPWNRE